MFRAFNFEISKERFEMHLKNRNLKEFDYYKKLGEENYSKDLSEVHSLLEQFLITDKKLDGDKIEEFYFPKIDKNVFISHSHTDKDLALAFSGYLKETHRLKPFIDSTVWGSITDLLKKLDDMYCKIQNKDVYDYYKRNYSTSHVHTMLIVSLSKMIDKTEALFFLNTPNSISNKSVITEKTNSPWIYAEVTLSQLIRKKRPERLLKESVTGEMRKQKPFEIGYTLEFSDYFRINSKILDDWYKKRWNAQFEVHSLDLLYSLYNDNE